jgi:hypothetical protein
MKAEGHRKQVALFLIALLLPVTVLVGLTLRMVRQERELALKRAADERLRVAAEIGRDLGAPRRHRPARGLGARGNAGPARAPRLCPSGSRPCRRGRRRPAGHALGSRPAISGILAAWVTYGPKPWLAGLTPAISGVERWLVALDFTAFSAAFVSDAEAARANRRRRSYASSPLPPERNGKSIPDQGFRHGRLVS